MSALGDIRAGLEADPAIAGLSARVFGGSIPQGELADRSTPIVQLVFDGGLPSGDAGVNRHPRIISRCFHTSEAAALALRYAVLPVLERGGWGRVATLSHVGGPNPKPDDGSGWAHVIDTWSVLEIG